MATQYFRIQNLPAYDQCASYHLETWEASAVAIVFSTLRHDCQTSFVTPSFVQLIMLYVPPPFDDSRRLYT